MKKRQVTVMGICTVGAQSDEFVIRSPAFINVCKGNKSKKQIMIPMFEIEGSGSAEIRKRAHEMVDKALDDFEVARFLMRKIPEGTIKVWSDKEVDNFSG